MKDLRITFRTLIVKAQEGLLTEEDRLLLNSLMRDAENRQLYFEIVKLNCALMQLESSEYHKQQQLAETKSTFDVWLWEELANEERKAPAVEVPLQETPKTPLPPLKLHRTRLHINRSALVTAFLSAVAMLLVIFFGQFVPAKGLEVATLTDSVDAEWTGAGGAMERGTRLVTGRQPVFLRKGLAQLQFDSNVHLIFEAPAEFQIISDDKIMLNHGRVYVTVPSEAIGFTVNTATARIIDLGTQFGVEADARGDTYLHVVQGKTALIAGEKSNTLSTIVGQQAAMMVSGVTSAVSSIRFDDGRFARSFDSSNNVVWRKQPSLDLADIVRNGNGLGTGNSQVRLNHEKGFTKELRGGHTSTFEAYLPISNNPFIDGIFIPNGKTVVSSQGDVFEEFPFTNGVYCADVFGNPVPETLYLNEQQKTIQFNGQEYSERAKSCIFMPGSNHGVTFDLDAIRNHYHLKVDRFTSQVGLSDFDNKRCNANFYVLVDGKVRYSLLGYTQKGVLNDVSVKLEDSDRFLTLAASENVDQIDYMANSTFNNNWCVFAEPVLILE